MRIHTTCQPGFETILAHELEFYGMKPTGRGTGWVRAQSGLDPTPFSPICPDALCFGLATLKDPLEVKSGSVNTLADKLVDVFTQQLGDRKVTAPWPFWMAAAQEERLIHRAKAVEDRFLEVLKKKMSRVARLASRDIPAGPHFVPGFFVFFSDFDLALVSSEAHSGGQQRMKMDDLAPSRSYLKVEEAYHILGSAPGKGDTVVDLGAAPGGWSHSALKRHARVIAVDNGSLKDPVKSHPRIRHLRADALKFVPGTDSPADWLLCDIIEDSTVIYELLRLWLRQRWCRYFIVNFKLGRADPILLLKKIHDPKDGLAPYCRHLKVRHLYHDREEITVVGEHL